MLLKNYDKSLFDQDSYDKQIKLTPYNEIIMKV